MLFMYRPPLVRPENFLKNLLTPTQRNSLEYIYREEGKANDDSE